MQGISLYRIRTARVLERAGCGSTGSLARGGGGSQARRPGRHVLRTGRFLHGSIESNLRENCREGEDEGRRGGCVRNADRRQHWRLSVPSPGNLRMLQLQKVRGSMRLSRRFAAIPARLLRENGEDREEDDHEDRLSRFIGRRYRKQDSRTFRIGSRFRHNRCSFDGIHLRPQSEQRARPRHVQPSSRIRREPARRRGGCRHGCWSSRETGGFRDRRLHRHCPHCGGGRADGRVGEGRQGWSRICLRRPWAPWRRVLRSLLGSLARSPGKGFGAGSSSPDPARNGA